MDFDEFWKSYKFDSKLINKIAEISKYLGILEASYIPTSLRQSVTRQERIKALLECDNIIFSLDCINEILAGTKQSLIPVEQCVFNLNEAYEKFNKESWRKADIIKKIHNVLIRRMECDAEQIDINFQSVLPHNPDSWDISNVCELLIWIADSGEHPLILAGVFYYAYSKIQSSLEFGKRVNRFCVVNLLSQWDPIIAALPLEDMLLKSKDAYDKALLISPNEVLNLLSNDVLTLLAAQVKCCQNALLIPESQRRPVNKLVTKLLPVLKDGALSAIEILTKLGLKDVKSFRRNYLARAIKMDLIANTNPKPTSPHQEYALTQKGIDHLKKYQISN